MNTDDDVNLELALGSKTYSVKKRSKNSLGAGVNADSRVNMAFAASDPVSELVWSPINGLSLIRVNSSAADEKPVRLWNVGPNTKYILSKRNEDDDNAVNQGNLSVSEMVVDANDILGDKSTLVGPSRSFHARDVGQGHGDDDCNDQSNGILEGEGGPIDAIFKENSTDNGDEDLCRAENVQIVGVDEISIKDAELITLADGTSDCKVDENLEVADLFEPIATNLPEGLGCSSPNSQSLKKPDDEVTSPFVEMNNNIANTPLPIPALPLKKLESSAENEMCRLEGCILGEKGSPTNSRVRLYREKGKERALSDGDMYERSSNSEDDSHESVESCNNSARSFAKGVKRKSNEQELVLGTKRMKTRDSSFMNWISNMVKGLKHDRVEDFSSRALTLACPNDVYDKNQGKTRDCAGQNTGFQNLFQSLYCGKTNMLNTGVGKGNDSTEESKKLMGAEKLLLENSPGSCNENKDNSCKQIVVSNNPVVVGQPSRPWISKYGFENYLVENKDSENLVGDTSKDDSGKQMTRTEGNPNGPGKSTHSLWITRFSSRTPNIEKCDNFTREFHDCSTYSCRKVNIHKMVNNVYNAEVKLTSKLSPILPLEKLKKSEAMASVLARRLDALRHITPLKRRNSSNCSIITCFFCGFGHDLRECPDLAKDELEDLVSKMHSFDGIEEFPCLCLRCFRLDHWAISCPLFATSSGNLRLEQSGSFIGPYTANHPPLNADKRVSTSNEIGKSTKSNSANNVNYNKKIPLCNIVTTSNKVTPAGYLRAIRNLHLSRSEILRWMNTNVSLSELSGFFLRLRLGKSGKELMGSCYYVACIAGDVREHKGCGSKKSIVVDVGGIKSSVGSQYVSNHDFLEDEINAWWCKTVESGCKIPTLDELTSKFNNRKSLGF